MPRKQYDPLAVIPSPEAIRARLTETQSLAERLRILLEVSERLRLPLITGDQLADPNTTKNEQRSALAG